MTKIDLDEIVNMLIDKLIGPAEQFIASNPYTAANLYALRELLRTEAMSYARGLAEKGGVPIDNHVDVFLATITELAVAVVYEEQLIGVVYGEQLIGVVDRMKHAALKILPSDSLSS